MLSLFLVFFFVIFISTVNLIFDSIFIFSPNFIASVLSWVVLYCVALYCIVLHCVVLYCFALYCIVLYCVVLFLVVFYCIVFYCFVLYCFVLYFILFYFILFYCTALSVHHPRKLCQFLNFCIVEYMYSITPFLF